MAHPFGKTTIFAKALIFPALLAFAGLLVQETNAQTATTSPSQQASIDPNQLVLEAVRRAVWGPSFSCRIRQISTNNLHQVVAEGQYWQLGQGTGQSKMVLAFKPNRSEAITNLLQVSDGRLLWTNLNGEPPRRVYLDRVRQSLGSLVRDPRQHPEAALYMAVGGHAEVMRCLYVRYRWNRIVAGTDDQGRDAWQLLGVLRTEPPRPGSNTKVDDQLIVTNPSPEVPTEVRLTLSRDEKSLLFPYRIDYYLRERSEDGGPGKRIHISTIERDEFVSPISVSPDFFHFQVSDEAEQIDDETTDYMPLFPLAEH